MGGFRTRWLGRFRLADLDLGPGHALDAVGASDCLLCTVGGKLSALSDARCRVRKAGGEENRSLRTFPSLGGTESVRVVSAIHNVQGRFVTYGQRIPPLIHVSDGDAAQLY